MKIVAVIPVKVKSERVKSKNFTVFYRGKSLFDLLIDKLKSVKEIDTIYISSNATHLKDSAEKLGCEFIRRNDKYCNNNIPWSDVIAHVAESIPESNDSSIAWCHTTSPLFNKYDLAIRSYLENVKKCKYDGLVTTVKISEFLVSKNKQPLNYSWGPWHKYSQYLDQIYAITGALFIASKHEMVQNRYVISKNPLFYEVNPLEAIDIDTPYDFELAKLLMENKNILEKHV